MKAVGSSIASKLARGLDSILDSDSDEDEKKRDSKTKKAGTTVPRPAEAEGAEGGGEEATLVGLPPISSGEVGGGGGGRRMFIPVSESESFLGGAPGDPGGMRGGMGPEEKGSIACALS